MAAAIFVPPSPHDLLCSMSTGRSRVPLVSISNATNSPHRSLTSTIQKRPRAPGNVSQQENEPPLKRQMLEKDVESLNPSTPRRHIPESSVEGRVFERGSTNAQPTAFQKKLVAARDKGSTLKFSKNNERPAAPESTENIRQWQKHYRKAFPSFSFYFESIPGDVRAKFVKQIATLGAVSLLVAASLRCVVWHGHGQTADVEDFRGWKADSYFSKKRDSSRNTSRIS